MESPTQIRNRIRASRRALDPEVRLAKSVEICNRLAELDSFKSARHVAAYLAFDGEADPMELMISSVDRGKHVYLPIIVGQSEPLVFAPWTRSTTLVKNRFDILEPEVDQADLITADKLDLVVCPLVAFDETLNRIGVGGGYYDRTFAFVNQAADDKQVQLVGFAFELQKLDSIEPKPWDVRLDAVVTESQGYT